MEKIPASDQFNEHIIKYVLIQYNSINSPNWKQWILSEINEKSNLHRKRILQSGAVNFTQNRVITYQDKSIVLNPDELALLHTYYYIEMHYYSLRQCLSEIQQTIMPILDYSPMLIDFGCGASTAGLTVADFYSLHNHSKPLHFIYQGVDLSTSMLELGKCLVNQAPFIDKGSEFHFNTSINDIDVSVHKGAVVLIFSYVMKHIDNIVNELADWIINTLIPHQHQIVIINQNSINHGYNNNWNKLFKRLQEANPNIVNYEKILEYRFNPSPQIPWENGTDEVGFKVKFNYICFN